MSASPLHLLIGISSSGDWGSTFNQPKGAYSSGSKTPAVVTSYRARCWAVEVMVEEQPEMASLNAAKQQLRAAMKLKLGAIPRESAITQSTTFPLAVKDRGSWAKCCRRLRCLQQTRDVSALCRSQAGERLSLHANWRNPNRCHREACARVRERGVRSISSQEPVLVA